MKNFNVGGKLLPFILLIILSIVTISYYFTYSCLWKKPGESLRCFENRVENVNKLLGTEYTLAYVDKVIFENSDITTTHLSLHKVGNSSYEKSKNLKEALVPIEKYMLPGKYSWAFDGYRHGVYQSYLKEKSEMGIGPVQAIKSICGKYENLILDNFDIELFLDFIEMRQCFHAMGHALMFISANNIDMSLSYCDMLPANLAQNEWCYFGVFMEASYLFWPEWNPDTPINYSKYESLLPICNSFLGTKKKMCESYVGRSNLFFNFGNTNDSILKCKNIDNKEGILNCVGRTARKGVTNLNSIDDFKKMSLACVTEFSNEFTKKCIEGMAAGVYLGQTQLISHLDFCENLPKEYKKICIENGHIRNFDTADSYNEYHLYSF
jgi:hypothetical protein